MYVRALHTVHALPDLRVAGGHLGDGLSSDYQCAKYSDLEVVGSSPIARPILLSVIMTVYCLTASVQSLY